MRKMLIASLLFSTILLAGTSAYAACCTCLGYNRGGGGCGGGAVGGSDLTVHCGLSDQQVLQDYLTKSPEAKVEYNVKGVAFDTFTGWGCKK